MRLPGRSDPVRAEPRSPWPYRAGPGGSRSPGPAGVPPRFSPGTGAAAPWGVPAMPGSRCPRPALPILRWLPRYSRAWLPLDLLAGLAVGLTTVPQALAYAELAGLPLQYGLYSSFMGCFVYCFLGTAKDVTLGPTAIMSLLVSSYAFHEPVYAVLLTFLSGCIQLAMGLLHLGFLLDFISCPVIKGFTSAASITISFNQIKNILGLQGIPRQFFLQVYETLRRIWETRAGDAVLGLTCLAVLTGLRAMKSHLPQAAPAEPLAVRISYLIVWISATGLDLVPLCVTFLLCFWEVQYGIVAGVLVSGILLLYSIARPPIKVSEGAVLLVQLGSSLHFPAVEHLRDSVCSRALAAASPPRSVILDCCHVSSIDYTVVVGLSELLQELRRHGLSLAFCGLKVCGTSATPPQARGGCVLRGSAQLPSPVACAGLSSGGTVIMSSTLISQSWRLRMQGAGKGWVLCAGMAGGSAPEGWEVASTPPAQVSLPSGPCSPGPPVCRLRRIPAFPQLGGGRAVRGSGAGGQRGRALHQHCREHGAHPVR
ncbi:sodium-independent sulfate anion transporter isoform X8 [Corvus cornix cornix]|uniref:sodium-independent sulfate anion transporter isoform X8 n=1 Tax=Corvus cornix cornix TaxID=932674 RepID=UPI00195297D5|nr:sodium-independent sulfate anion transporter isoform X8 [Corvus cornix cornix]